MSQLFYIIGASGVGKDSLITYAREKISGNFPVIFAHRYITRPAHAGGENHVSLSHTEFSFRKSRGLFAMDWQSHGNCYGIGSEIDNWLEANIGVVVNGSREYLPQAMQKYPFMTVVLVKASQEAIHARLTGRKREDISEIQKRIARSRELDFEETNGIIIVHNEGPLNIAGEEMTSILLSGSTVEALTPSLAKE